MTLAGRTYWLVGASEGIGASLAQNLDRAGARLILSSRSKERLCGLAGSLKTRPHILPLDVTNPEAVAAEAEMLDDIDGVIYMAGSYWPMRTQNWDSARIDTMVQVNFLGGVNILNAVVPTFVERDRGHIVIIGSLAGLSGLPGAIGYAASKAALMHLGLDMQKDLKGTGVFTQIINPGFVRTRLTAKNDFAMPFVMDVDDAAAHITKAMQGRRKVVSFPALFALLFKIRRALGL